MSGSTGTLESASETGVEPAERASGYVEGGRERDSQLPNMIYIIVHSR